MLAQPLRIVKKTTATGVEENFVYGVGHMVKFTDGRSLRLSRSGDAAP
jgi:hypothetical protein